MFHTKTGYANTNNPVENFNGDIKKTYTQRKRSSIVDVISIMTSMVKTESFLCSSKEISITPSAPKRFITQGKLLFKDRKLN